MPNAKMIKPKNVYWILGGWDGSRGRERYWTGHSWSDDLDEACLYADHDFADHERREFTVITGIEPKVIQVAVAFK